MSLASFIIELAEEPGGGLPRADAAMLRDDLDGLIAGGLLEVNAAGLIVPSIAALLIADGAMPFDKPEQTRPTGRRYGPEDPPSLRRIDRMRQQPRRRHQRRRQKGRAA